MKLPSINMTSNDNLPNITNGGQQSQTNTTRSGRQSSLSNGTSKRQKGESIAQAVANAVGNPEAPTSRYTTMKRAAEEQRRRVRMQRERQIEEERAIAVTRRQEELKTQIRSVMDSILVDVRKDVLLILQERLNEEKCEIKADLHNQLEQAETDLARKVENRVTNGESFDVRVARAQKEFEGSFNKILKSELGNVQKEIKSDVAKKIDLERKRWEENFNKDADKRVRAVEEAIRTDFRVGLEDSQKQCSDIITSTQERTGSIEQKLTSKIIASEVCVVAKIEESQATTRDLIDGRIAGRDKILQDEFNKETEALHKQIDELKKDVSQLQSKCCVIS